jgi:hypothetical protein
MAHLTTARKNNLSVGVKGYFTDNGAKLLGRAIVRAYAMPTLSSAGITTDKAKTEAVARREFAMKNKAILIDCSEILAPNKAGEITHSRPENTVRARLFSIAKAMGLPEDTFFAIRSEKYVKGETPKVYIVRK